MGVGVWDPGGGDSDKHLDQELLDRFLRIANESGETVTSELLASHELETSEWVMALEPESWDQAQALSTIDLVALIRFFTLIEDQISGWEAGRTSPVIALVKMLKERGEFTSDLRKWIKAHTDNRYLPHGSAL